MDRGPCRFLENPDLINSKSVVSHIEGQLISCNLVNPLLESPFLSVLRMPLISCISCHSRTFPLIDFHQIITPTLEASLKEHLKAGSSFLQALFLFDPNGSSRDNFEQISASVSYRGNPFYRMYPMYPYTYYPIAT